MIEDPDRCYQAAQSKDARFDGRFFCAVTSTGIYCRPSCPARTPKRENMRFYATAAAAQQAGFRACLRCRPDATPGSPEWNVRADVVARAMRLIRDGIVDREGVEGLAAPPRLQHAPAEPPHHRRGGHRAARPGAGAAQPDGARPARDDRPPRRPRRLRRRLRQRAPVQRHGAPDLRRHAERAARPGARGRRRAGARAGAGAPQAIRLRLPCRRPFNPASVLDFLGLRALPGVEALDGASYRAACASPTGTAS